MKIFNSPTIIIASLSVLLQLVVGVPLALITEHAVATSGHDADTHAASIIARDVSNNGVLNGASAGSVMSRINEIAPVKSSQVNAAAELTPSTDHANKPRDGPFGVCVNAFAEGGKQGKAVRDICLPYNHCIDFAPWASGGVRSMDFRGATICFLYTTEFCGGNRLLQINEDSPGVNMANGAEFVLGGPWMSAQCGRAW